MAVNGYLIEKYNHMAGAYTCHRLVHEAKALGMDLKIVGVHDTLVGGTGLTNGGEPLAKRDFAIQRYKWGKIKDAICRLAARSYNDTDGYNLYVNKFAQVSRLRSDAFAVPEYLLGTSQSPYEAIAAALGDTFVAKGLESSMGEEILLIQTPGDMESLAAGYGPEKEWLFEKFITTSYGRDVRIYSIRGEAAACMQRSAKGDFRANVALGADVKPYEITPEIRLAARDIYEQTGLDFLGIDLLFGGDGFYFCEINVMPGLEGIEKASGVNIAGKIMETIREDFFVE